MSDIDISTEELMALDKALKGPKSSISPPRGKSSTQLSEEAFGEILAEEPMRIIEPRIRKAMEPGKGGK